MSEIAPDGTSRKGAVLLVILGLCAFAVLLGLGTWQVQRLIWKEELIASIDTRIVSPPRPLAEIEARLADTGEIDYWPVTVAGVFHHEGERHFFATHKGQTGYFIYTPLELDDGRFVFVNRGFVPFDRKEATSRPQGQIAGLTEISGLARDRLDEKPNSFMPDNDPAKNIFYWKDLDVMAQTSGVGEVGKYLPLFIDAGNAPNPGGLPIGAVTLTDLPNTHLQYAITWYGLAAALLGVLGAWLWRRWRSAT